MPSAFVPPDHSTPPALVYIARSTTSGAGLAPRLSTSAPKRLPTAAGNSVATSTLKRLLAPTAKVRTAVEPSSKQIVTRTEPAAVPVLASRM